MQTTVKMMRFTQKSRLEHPFFFNIYVFLVPTIGRFLLTFYVGKIKGVLSLLWYNSVFMSCTLKGDLARGVRSCKINKLKHYRLPPTFWLELIISLWQSHVLNKQSCVICLGPSLELIFSHPTLLPSLLLLLPPPRSPSTAPPLEKSTTTTIIQQRRTVTGSYLKTKKSSSPRIVVSQLRIKIKDSKNNTYFNGSNSQKSFKLFDFYVEKVRTIYGAKNLLYGGF